MTDQRRVEAVYRRYVEDYEGDPVLGKPDIADVLDAADAVSMQEQRVNDDQQEDHG